MSSLKLLAAAALAAPTCLFLSMPASAAPTAATCQPLSATNLEECCAAQDWRDIIREGDFRFCPPLNNDDKSGRAGDDLVDGGGVDPGTGGGGDPGTGGGGTTPPDTTGSIGNPGNDKGVGGAGEQDKGPTGDSTGTKGASN